MSSGAGKKCAACRKNLGRDGMACVRCKTTLYCSKNCQTTHWKEHKPECKRLCTEKVKKAETLRENLAAVAAVQAADSPAARGPVGQEANMPAVFQLFTADQCDFRWEATARRLEILYSTRAHGARYGECHIKLCHFVVCKYEDMDVAAVIGKAEEIDMAALAAFRIAHTNPAGFLKEAETAMMLWMTLGQSYFKAGMINDAGLPLLWAYDVATWLLTKAVNARVSHASVQSLMVMTTLALLHADDDVDPAAYTSKFAMPMLARLNELLPQLAEQLSKDAILVRPWFLGLTTMAFIKLGCYGRATGAHAQQKTAVEALLTSRPFRQLASAAAERSALHQKQLDYWNLVGAKLCFATKMHRNAMQCLNDMSPGSNTHPVMHVDSLLLSAIIHIENVYSRNTAFLGREHENFVLANKSVKAAETYLTENTGSLHVGQRNRLVIMLRKISAELRLRFAQYILRHGQVTFTTELELHGAIGAEINQCRSDMRTIMEAVRGGNGFFSSSTAYMPRMGLLHACYLVLTAYMAKQIHLPYTLRTFSPQEDLVTAKIELGKHNCALAKVHLAYLCTFQLEDGTQHVMDYLHILCAEYGQKFCAWCKTKTLEENNVCSRCTLTRYCSRFCQTAANNRMHNGGNLLEPPHSRICRVLVPYKKLHKATGGRGHIRASNTEAFSALVETRMLQGMQNPAAKHAFLELQRAIQKFLQHGPFSRPSSRG